MTAPQPVPTGTEDRVLTATEPLLQLRGVDKHFGAVQVLHGVDLDVYPGEVTALVGDNGAGKSTLIKGLAGIHVFDSGTYTFDGEPVHVTGPKQANALGIEVVYRTSRCATTSTSSTTCSSAESSPRAAGSTRRRWSGGPRTRWPACRCAP